MRLNMVFRDAIDPQDFADFAEEVQWVFHGAHPAVESAPAELTWATPAGVGVHLIEDEVLGLIYLSIENYSIEGVSERDLIEASRLVSGAFETIDARELIGLYHGESEWNGKVVALMMVAAVAGEYSPGICEVVGAGLESQNVDVRRAAAIASMYTPWEDLKGVVETVADRDPDDQVRDLAATSLLNFP
ncbi:hypothetical protein [Streptomyces sp. NPDC006645]|uniref:hypothetical protein n=1 Tax=unclassified Streptomyces TaxID=2593676 RepID=UPI00339E74DD